MRTPAARVVNSKLVGGFEVTWVEQTSLKIGIGSFELGQRYKLKDRFSSA
jgi:hypothetical protein